MKIVLAYVFPNVLLPTYIPLAQRFVKSYMEHPPGETDHELHVVVNGPSANESTRKLFHPLIPRFHAHNNYGKDIGAFMLASATVKCDLMVFMGSHIHFRRAGWLDRMVAAYLQSGPGLYGCWAFAQPCPHIRTTVFWCPPELLSSYPHPVDNHHRYNFEHGHEDSILKWALDCGFPVGMVEWSRLRMYPAFEHVTNEECLMLDQHSDRIGYR